MINELTFILTESKRSNIIIFTIICLNINSRAVSIKFVYFKKRSFNIQAVIYNHNKKRIIKLIIIFESTEL